MKKTLLIFCMIITIITMLNFNYIINASFETEINQLENEISENEHKVIITDEIKKEVEKTIDDTCNNNYICSTSDDVLYQKTIEEIQIENDGITEQENISYDGDIKGDGLDLLGAYQGLTYYSQDDSRWANMPYTSIGDTSQTMKTSGCGPTVAAMVVSSSKGAILPSTMANLFVSNGYRTAANGTAWSAFPFIADYFGFENYAYTTNLNTALNFLRNGYFVIVSCGNGLFTTNGHYIVLVGINGNTISIYDPYMYNGKFDTPSRRGKVTVSGHTIYCTIDNFEKYSNYRAFWCYSNDHGEGNSHVNSSSIYTAGNYQVTASALRVRSGPGTNYRIIKNVYRNSIQNIDYTNGNWGHLSNNMGWICLDYCNKIEASNTPPNKDTSTAYTTGNYRTVANLHVRFGPGTNYKIKTYRQLTPNARSQNKRLGNYYYNGLKNGVVATVSRIVKNGSYYWGKIPSGWICLNYCRKV